jgi:two-component system, NarL family, response regulator LiaR
MTNPIRLLIVDDHEVVREGLRAMLSQKPDMQVLGEARDGVEAVDKALTLHPDVILMDLAMPRMGGVEAIRAIKARQPDVRILVLTSFAEDAQVFPAIEAGALGYMLKDSTADTLVQAIRIVNRDEPALHPAVARKLMLRQQAQNTSHPDEALTPRERQTLVLLARGLSNQDIANQLSLSELTVRGHVSNILKKLNLENRTQAALYALRQGLVDLNP